MGRPSKISLEDRAELIRLWREQKLPEMKALAKQLGVSKYYGTILERRERFPRDRSRKRWPKARDVGEVTA